MTEEETVIEYFKTLKLYEFHALIKQEAKRRVEDDEDNEFRCEVGCSMYPMREEHVAIINLVCLSFYDN